MRIINRLKRTQKRFTGTKDYKLYTYEVTDELGNKEDVDSLQEYNEGDRVELWFDPQYNKAKMRPYKDRRS